MKIKIKFVILLLSLASLNSACEKEIDIITIEGYIRDEASIEPIAGIQIFVDAIKSSSGMGIITNGRRENVGQGTTDSKGYYKIKLKVFKEAERLEFFINGGHIKEGYVYSQPDIYLSTLNTHGNNRLDFKLSPTTLLKIKFKNASPVSDSDLFNFSYYSNGNGWVKGIVEKESCGTVAINEAANWVGKDVCGEYTVETIAEKVTQVSWTVTKNNVIMQYIDSVYVKRGVMNEFSINY